MSKSFAQKCLENLSRNRRLERRIYETESAERFYLNWDKIAKQAELDPELPDVTLPDGKIQYIAGEVDILLHKLYSLKRKGATRNDPEVHVLERKVRFLSRAVPEAAAEAEQTGNRRDIIAMREARKYFLEIKSSFDDALDSMA